jgi:hypothetical protein
MGDALERIRGLIAREPPTPGSTGGTMESLHRLCRAAVRALPASGAGVSVMSGTGEQGTAAASDPTCELIEELQFTLGEGPCMDAYASRRPVLAPDLASDQADGPAARWPAYTQAAREHGVHAVFAFPLQVGVARLGVLDVYCERSGALSEKALGQALSFADVAMMTLLDGQELAGQGETSPGLDDALGYRAELYQAQGMVHVQLGVGLEEAMTRLRAHAFVHDRRLGDVARDVVARRLRLERDDR